MPSNQISLTWLRSFEAAARHLNFTSASVELGLTQAAVSLHIRSLEQQLQHKLFVRRARHLSLTELGQAYCSTVRQALADIDMASANLFGSMATKTVTIKAPISTASLWLAPRLPSFKKDHPTINLRLVTNIWTETTNLEEIDVELRLGRGNWTDALSDKLSDETIVPICAKGRKNSAKQVQDLLSGPFVHILGHEGHWERYLSAYDCTKPQDAPQYLVDTTISALQLVASGGGYALVFSRLVNTENGLASGVRFAGKPLPHPDAHFLMQPVSKKAVRPEVEIFVDWLRKQFKEDV